MDWERIKEKVTHEVLQQLQAAQTGAPAPQAAAAPAVAQAAPTVGDDFRTDVLVVLAGPAADKAVALVEALSGSAKVTVVAEAGAGLPGAITTGNESTARRLVKGAARILAPVVTTSTAAKVSRLAGTDLPTEVLVQAALQGKPVTMAREALTLPAEANWTVRRKVEETVTALRTLGFTVAELADLVPAQRPAPAAVQPARAEVAATAPATDYDQELARMIDHTLLKPEATADQVRKLCAEARGYNFMSVCVNPTWVALAAEALKGSQVKVCTVIGFPLGATTSEVKAFETAETIRQGATEVDMVVNVGALKSGQHDKVLADIQAVVNAARGKALTKVIIETSLLTDAEKVKACELSKQAGADFVKTSTGFSTGGATVEDIALMRRTVGPEMGVKASGGIRDYDASIAMVTAGATRIGASASINIVKRVKAQPAAGKDKY
jgi:deoxyribose-phosphate aldolase